MSEIRQALDAKLGDLESELAKEMMKLANLPEDHSEAIEISINSRIAAIHIRIAAIDSRIAVLDRPQTATGGKMILL
jgi:hypothetical protein